MEGISSFSDMSYLLHTSGEAGDAKSRESVSLNVECNVFLKGGFLIVFHVGEFFRATVKALLRLQLGAEGLPCVVGRFHGSHL